MAFIQTGPQLSPLVLALIQKKQEEEQQQEQQQQQQGLPPGLGQLLQGQGGGSGGGFGGGGFGGAGASLPALGLGALALHDIQGLASGDFSVGDILTGQQGAIDTVRFKEQFEKFDEVVPGGAAAALGALLNASAFRPKAAFRQLKKSLGDVINPFGIFG